MDAQNAKRVEEIAELEQRLHDAARVAASSPEIQVAWEEVATLAGNVQRRARLLAGLGRGG